VNRLSVAFFFLAGCSIIAAPPPRPYDVEHYDVKIQPDIAAKRLSGEVTIRFHTLVDGLETLELDAGSLHVTAVVEEYMNQPFERQGPLLMVQLVRRVRIGEVRKLTIRYDAEPANGFEFYPDQVYTAYFTSHWMVANDRPDDRATLHLSISVPQNLKVAASGRLVSTHRDGQRSVSEWTQDAEVPPFTFGFAVGDFEEQTEQSDSVKLRYLGPRGSRNLAKTLEGTRQALRFLAEKTGQAYPEKTYTEVLASGSPAQEMAQFTLLSAKYGETLAAHPDDLWLLAHELAHQWYGIGIACRDWSDFWLNEGFATFFADAFLDQQFGHERYQQEIDKSRQIYEKLKAEGRDRALSFHDWTTDKQAGGEIPYQKGAWVLHLLRQQMGEDNFWRGMRVYTKDHWGGQVTSHDFQKSMEAASATSLKDFFDTWVYR
jgi:aminopeptidase N